MRGSGCFLKPRLTVQSTQTPDDDRVMNLVELALAQPPEERDAYLNSACGADALLHETVLMYVRAEERMKGFLLEPLCPPEPVENPFEPGEFVAGRFRIVDEVARGGMGVVYEATDEKLDRRVAIKCARAGYSRRLPPEVRNARAISHPNVCRIFEIHTAETPRGRFDFITMEFLEGETLAARLRNGPVPEPEARLIAKQLCAGLAEAHRNHVIHGDLKTGNIILTTGASGEKRAVITDFGLARGLNASLHTAQSGVAGGTPAYMAPELWKGEKASTASDVYALGVILFELVAGQKPWHSEKSREAMSWEQRLVWKPPAAHPKWDRVLARCLDTDPARRFGDADAIAKALGPSVSARWIAAAAAAILLAAVSSVTAYERAAAPKKSVRLSILPFTVSAGQSPQLAAELLRDTSAQLRRIRGNRETAYKLLAGKSAGATQVLQGTLANEDGKLAVAAWLADARSGGRLKEWKAEYAADEERFIPAALAGVVTEALHLPPLDGAPMVAPTARADYTAGINYTRQNSTMDSALPLLERAMKEDPSSPLTYAGLAEAQWFKYYATGDRVWLDRAAESVWRSEMRNPDVAAVHRIAGLLAANGGRHEQAVAEYQRAIEIEPDDSDAYRRLGMVYKTDGQMAQALAALRRAVELAPDYFKTHQELGAFYANTAKYREAADQFEKTVALAPNEPDAYYALGTAFLYLARYGDAETQFRIALRLAEAPKTLNNLGVALLYEGKDQEAIPWFSRAIKLSPKSSTAQSVTMTWMNLGTAYRRTHQTARSDAANRRGLELTEKQMAQDPRDGGSRSCLAWFCAQLGQKARAESEIAQALELSPNDALTRWLAIATYEALGARDEALDVLRGSPDAVIADISHWPDVADLHGDSRFLEMLANHQIK
jgi:tetratricopeptide (TPR) repeat protein